MFFLANTMRKLQIWLKLHVALFWKKIQRNHFKVSKKPKIKARYGQCLRSTNVQNFNSKYLITWVLLKLPNLEYTV
jgi:hypothetical protein